MNMLQRIVRPVVQVYLDLKMIWKMAIGFGLVLLAVLAIAWVSQQNLHKISKALDTVIDQELEPMAYIHDIRSYISELEVATRDALLQHDAVALRYIHNEFLRNTVTRTVDYSFERLSGQATGPEQRKRIAEIQGYWRDYAQLYHNLTTDFDRFQDAVLMQEITKKRFFLIGGIDRMIETDYRQRAVLAKAEARVTYEKQQFATLVVIIGTIVLTIAISLLTAFCIIRPLHSIAAGARKIAGGDLEVTVPEARNDEFGEVGHCFNAMASELRSLVEEIKQAAEKVNENSRLLLHGTHDASTVTQQLVETLSQVAVGAEQQQLRVASIHEVVRMVSDFSDFINRTVHTIDDLSENTIAKALHGEAVAGSVVEQMHRIEQFMSVSDEMMAQLQTLSQEIAKTAATVRDVADQTNLLALNATIEAARAGEHGRGFGVVAESIGQLALQTKTASNEVQKLVSRIQNVFGKLSGMIETENQVILDGERAVSGLGVVFDAIIAAARQVNQELGTVTHYTVRLTEEHSQVLKAVEQITRIATEHQAGTESASSAVVEHHSCTQEMIAASQILAHWGDNLRQAVAKFT